MLENRLGRELISPCLRLALLASLVGGVADAGATIVTAPLASSQPLINPSAAAYRLANGVFVAAQQTNEQTDALDLIDSTFNVAVGLRTYDFAFFAALGHFHFEFNISQQAGVKNTDSTVTSSTFDSSTHATTNSLNLVPIQVIAAYKFGGWSFGLKRLMTFVNYGSNQNFSIATADALTSVNETATQESDFAVNGAGLTINLFGSNVYVASGVDLIELNSKLDLNGQTSLTQDGKTGSPLFSTKWPTN